jgi:hypothetical protein
MHQPDAPATNNATGQAIGKCRICSYPTLSFKCWVGLDADFLLCSDPMASSKLNLWRSPVSWRLPKFTYQNLDNVKYFINLHLVHNKYKICLCQMIKSNK